MMICQRLACVALSTSSSVMTSHEMQLSMLSRNHCWVVLKIAAFAFMSVLVRRQSSLTVCIFIPRGNTVAAEEYSCSILFLKEAGSALSTLMCSAFTLLCLLHLVLLLHHQWPCILMLHVPQWSPRSGSLMLLYQICLPRKVNI